MAHRWQAIQYKVLASACQRFLGKIDVEGRCSDRKSTRLNSSHRCISYAVFCLKKKTRQQPTAPPSPSPPCPPFPSPSSSPLPARHTPPTSTFLPPRPTRRSRSSPTLRRSPAPP